MGAKPAPPGSNSRQDASLQSVSERTNLIVTEGQPLGHEDAHAADRQCLQQVSVTVRDLALSCGREVPPETHGQDSELAGTIIAAITEPLTHLARSPIDHGIDLPRSLRQGKAISPMLSSHEHGCPRLTTGGAPHFHWVQFTESNLRISP